MIELVTLGVVDVKDGDGRALEPLHAQPKRLALLIYLVLSTARLPHRRDSLAALFWPELDRAHARAALRQAVRFLRSQLGERVVRGGTQEEVWVSAAALWCDVRAFEEACETGRPEEALALYRGDFLDGFDVATVSPEFGPWVDAERARLRQRAAQAACVLAAQSRAQGELQRAVETEPSAETRALLADLQSRDAHPRTPLSVLIVDDDPALLQALPQALRLRMGGVTVETADSAAAALERIAVQDYDAIVTDIKMPGMDGLALLAEIRARRPDSPTLIITGHGENELVVRALRGGACDFIQKPIDRDYFVAALYRAIRAHVLNRRAKDRQLALQSCADDLERVVQTLEHELPRMPRTGEAELVPHAGVPGKPPKDGSDATSAGRLERLTAALGGRYTIERELGHGGMATVYLARDLKHDRPVALKVLRPELAASLGAERFLREIQVTAHLTHPNILPLLDSGRVDEFLYYTAPYVEGESLRTRLNREMQLPVDEALRLAIEVAGALDYAHRHQIVHRDIKPENILLEEGQAVVADFGVARAIHAAEGEQVTETGLAVGTAAYMSPEQAAGEGALDGRSDIYSLACVLYEMLAGEPPHTGPSMQAVMAKRLAAPVPDVRTLRDSVPEAVERVLQRALARAPVDRFATAAEMAGALFHPSADPVPGGSGSVISTRRRGGDRRRDHDGPRSS